MRVRRAAAAASVDAPASDLVSLADRMGSLRLVRIGLVAVALATALAAPSLVPSADVLTVSAVYAILSAIAEVARRWAGRGLALIGVVLLLDVTYLSWIAYVSGGAASPLRFLIYGHLVAVTLTASHRTGLKLAAWNSLLYLATSYAEAAGILQVRELVPEWLPPHGAFVVVAPIVAFGPWLVTLATAGLSAVNERELRRRSRDLDRLAEMARELDRSGDVDDVARVLATHVERWLGCPRLLVLRRTEELATVVASIPDVPSPAARFRARPDDVIDRAWEKRRSELVHALDPDADPMLASSMPDAENVVVTPMSAEGEVVGALVVEHGRDRDRIHRWTLVMLERFASHAALVMHNAALLEELRRMAATDGLTGIANRRTFEEALAREVSRAERSGEPVTLVMLDVDHFKRLNDERGHQTGDDVLRALGNGLAGNLRPFDTAARYGGEEFAVIMPGCTLEESRIAAERIRRQAAGSSPIPTITVSAGAATFPDHARDAAELVRAADAALYRSKREGRDRLTIGERELTST